jgi:hypothetical protein
MKKQQKTTEKSPSELLLRRSFEPLLSPKDNKARLTFVGYQHSILEWKKDGQQITKPVLKLVFSVLDRTHENPANIAITCDYRYNPNNRLGTTLKLMGFEVEETTQIVDEDDDEYGTKVNSLDTESLFHFLRQRAGSVYKGLLRTVSRTDKQTGEKKEAKGLWEIDFTSIEPLMSKDGVQKRDTTADELGSAIASPKVDFESEAD